jgi:hypothetical protein
VEKPVEIVEKYEFSTAIPEISNSVPTENQPIKRWLFQQKICNGEIMSPLQPVGYL